MHALPYNRTLARMTALGAKVFVLHLLLLHLGSRHAARGMTTASPLRWEVPTPCVEGCRLRRPGPRD